MARTTKSSAGSGSTASASSSRGAAETVIAPVLNDAAHQEFARFLKAQRIGSARAATLREVGIETLDDLIFRYPTRHLNTRDILPISEARRKLGQAVTIRGRVIGRRAIRGRAKPRGEITLRDDAGGVLVLVYFEYPDHYVNRVFQMGTEYLVHGGVGQYHGVFQIVQPKYVEALEADHSFALEGMVPIYSIPTALKKARMNDAQFRSLVHAAVEFGAATHVREILPESLIASERLMPRVDAVREIHYPRTTERLMRATRRLVFEEVFYLQLRLAVERYRMRKAARGAIRFEVDQLASKLASDTVLNQMRIGDKPERSLSAEVLASLPYQLTQDQRAALLDILRDMSKPEGRTYPMNRLLQGDVGSGKTIVGLMAMLVAVENGYQCALMAPTEVLAAQHFATISKILDGTAIRCTLLIGGQSKKIRTTVLDGIASGETHIVIGTHALIQGKVRFHRLGFIVTDEQHRFGVMQRKALIDKSSESPTEEVQLSLGGRAVEPRRDEVITPDVLVMSATPIPRTIALALYGDIEVSTIRELPKGRQPIESMLLYEYDRERVYAAARRRIKERGEQVFIVYPLRTKSATVEAEAAEKAFETLQAGEFSDMRLGLIHGKMTSGEKQEIMQRFRDREFDVLVATTVIEVGVDVPNATVMIIEGAERFGIAQLHQLRGRVGRGSARSACVLIASNKLSGDPEYLGGLETSDQLEQLEIARQRLQSVVATSDGFVLAELDAEMRGTGDILGLRQSGQTVLRIGSLTRDVEIVDQTLIVANELIADDPQLRKPEHAMVRTEFLGRYRDADSYLHVG